MPDDPAKRQKERSREIDPECDDAEAFLTSILDSLHQHVAVVERDGKIIAINRAWREFARNNDAKSHSAVSEESNYLEVCRSVSDDDRVYAQKALEGIQKVLDCDEEIFSLEYPCSSPTQERWFLMTVVPMQRPEGGAVITHTNISKRKRAEEELRQKELHLRESREEYRALARELLKAREGARRQLARDLHDSLSQRLALISMLAAKMEIDQDECESIRSGLKQIQDEAAKLSVDVHDIARQLHPQILEDLGLAVAVESFCASFSKNEGIPIDFSLGQIPDDLPLETALNLYRIVQESLRNVAKHANASRVTVGLGAQHGTLRLSIRDDGIGYDPKRVRQKKRLGLVSLRERASLIGGRMDISSAPGSGTEITVEVPLGAG